MNSTVKELWISALTSGEYQQAQGQLRRGDAFCCYGVLCDLHRKETGKSTWGSHEMFYVGDHEGLFGPPTPVSEWAGFLLISCDTEVTIDGHRMDLAQHNDAGRTFAEIASAIREQL